MMSSAQYRVCERANASIGFAPLGSPMGTGMRRTKLKRREPEECTHSPSTRLRPSTFIQQLSSGLQIVWLGLGVMTLLL